MKSKNHSLSPARLPRLKGRLLLLAFGLGVSLPSLADTTTTTVLAPGITYRHHTYNNLYSSQQETYVLDLDLSVPGVDMKIAGSSGTLKTVSSHGAGIAHAIAAVNGNMFSGTAMIEYTKANGGSISPSSTFTGDPTMAAIVRTAGHALSVIPRNSTADWPTTVAGYTDALASHPRLVTFGSNDTFDPNDHTFAGARNPRTCAAWTMNNHLYIAAIDGRRTSAAGMTCLEEQTYLNNYAANLGTTVYNAVNFDGGGSTTMWRSDAGVMNQPSNGSETPVVDAIVVTYSTPPPFAENDFDGDGAADFVDFRPSDGTWHIDTTDGSGFIGFSFGQSGDKPLQGDFTGDLKADAVLFRPSTATWYVRFSNDGSIHSFQFGQNTDIPLVGGDFSNDGVDDAVLFRPSTGTWYVRFSQDAGIHSFQFGTSGDVPLLGGDFDGDGSPDAVIFRPSTSTWYVRFSSDAGIHSFSFGQTGDIPLIGGDYSGDGDPDAIVFRPSTGMWYVRFSQDGAIHSFQFGQSGDIPMVGMDFTGDGKLDYALYRPSTGTWYVRNSVTGAITSTQYGLSTDIPVH